jgi:hypothetical protein
MAFQLPPSQKAAHHVTISSIPFIPFVLAAGGTATATDFYCVSGPGAVGDASLVNALTLASFRAHQFGSDAEIRVQQRAEPYLLSSAPDWEFDEPDPYNGLNLLGGYSDANCTGGSRVVNPTNTAINIALANNPTNTFNLIGNGDIKIEGIRFSALQGARINIGSELAGSANADVKRNIFEGPAFFSNYSTDDGIEKLVIYSNIFRKSDTCGVTIETGHGTATAFLINNTIVNNKVGVCASGIDTKVVLYNNIIWSNADYGIKDQFSGYESIFILVDNLLQTPNQIQNVSLDQGSINADPLFDAGTLHLSIAPKSPAIDTGSDSLPGGVPVGADLEGGHRPTGLHVDRGANESPYNSVSNVITVDSNSDLANPGQGKTSLRGALIQSSQSNTPLTIKFNIPSLDCGGVEQAITLNSLLPDITKSVTIDGYAQDNSRYNTSTVGFNAETCITIVSGASLGSAFHVPSSAGSGVQLTLSGLRIAGFKRAVDLQAGEIHRLSGNSFLSRNGVANLVDIQVTAPAKAIIGGDDVSERNLLASATDAAVLLGSDGNSVIGNLIGPGIDGVFDPYASNATGIRIVNADGNGITRNTISGNEFYGVNAISSHGNFVQYNIVGINDGGTCGLSSCGPGDDRSQPNGGPGIHFDANSSQNFVFGNEIAYNPVGVCIASNKIAMVGNRIHDSAVLGVDLDTGGGGANTCAGIVAPIDNDVANLPISPNGGQNYPVILWAGGQDGSGMADGKNHDGFVRGQLPSKDGNFTVYVFANKHCGPQGYGDGEELVGTAEVTVNDAGTGNGLTNFEVPVASKLPLVGRSMTAQARDDATGNISEFSRCAPFARDTLAIATDDRIFVDSLELKPIAN